MNSKTFLGWCASIAVAAGSTLVHAMSTVGQGATIVIPVVAQTGTYQTEVWVRNQLGIAPITVDVRFYEAKTSASPGLKTCSQAVVQPFATVAFSLATQCALGAGSHFGMLVIEDAAAEKVDTFLAYSRTQNFAAIGFSIEGFPIGALSPQSQTVLGVKRSAAPIAFQTNCFVAALGQPVSYRIRLRDGTTNGQLGGDVIGTLQPYEMDRHLDIFNVAGLTSGDYTNVTARIEATNPFSPGDYERPVFIGFCTVQDNASFGADFRIGKALDAFDYSQNRGGSGCTPGAGCPTPYDWGISDAAKKDVFWLFVRPPDNIKCQLLSDRLSDLELRLREPGTYPLPLTFSLTAGGAVAGGDNQTSFYYSTGPVVVRASDGNGLRTFWALEVSARETVPAPTVPIPYSLDCRSGNGVFYTAPYSAADDF
jgi:hypothetical protein